MVVGLLGAECAAVAASLWTRPPAPTGRTDLTILTVIPVLSPLWPWLFAAGALILIPIAVSGWTRYLHVVLGVGGGIHVSYGLASAAVATLNDTGYTLAAMAGALGMFYLLSALSLARALT